MKSMIQNVFLLLIFPLVILYKICILVCCQDSTWQSFMQFLSLAPGKIGSFQRIAFARLTMNHCHPNVFIGFGALFSHCDTDIAEGVYIGPQCNVGKCSIGANTLLGSGVHILSGKHQHDFSDPNIPIKDQGGVFEKISIGDNCWVGNNAVVMANVGDNSVIAAGSVVVNDVPEGVIVGGNPGKVLREICK